jgi:hypothetical protein
MRHPTREFIAGRAEPLIPTRDLGALPRRRTHARGDPAAGAFPVKIKVMHRCELCGGAFRGQGDNANRFCSLVCWYQFKRRKPEVIEAARLLWLGGMRTPEIARRLKLKNKDVVIGLAHRNDFPRHPSRVA